MPVLSPTRPVTADEVDPQAPPRWHSLDVLKGVALWAMIAHHFHKWAGGDVNERFIGFDRLVVTDLAAPVFAVALGAAAVVVGARIDRWSDLPGPVWRWTQVLLVGLALDVIMHGTVEGRGVLVPLAILGFVVTLATAAGARRPWAWWAVAAVCAIASVPATQLVGDAPVLQLLNGPFSVAVYGVFVAAGAAVAAHNLGRPERSLPLVRAAAGVLAAGLVAASVAGGVVAPDGIWPPARYPGHLAFTLWGLVASLVIWAIVREVLPTGSTLGDAAARAGRRTLLVFAGHLAVRFVIQEAGLLGDLDTRAWGLVTWAAALAVCAASAAPRGRRRTRATPVTP